MNRLMTLLLVAPICLVGLGFQQADGYEMSRTPDGPFAFSISGITLNEGSSLQRESILFNDPSCPVLIAGHSTSIEFKDRGFRFIGKSELELAKDIQAIEVRTALYDVFGMHIQNLSNMEVRDCSAGKVEIDAEWRASENDISELLTTATFVSRVRYTDGTQWVFDKDQLELALVSLDLEKVVEDDNE